MLIILFALLFFAPSTILAADFGVRARPWLDGYCRDEMGWLGERTVCKDRCHRSVAFCRRGCGGFGRFLAMLYTSAPPVRGAR